MRTRDKLIAGITFASIAGQLIDKLVKKDNIRTNTQTSFNVSKDSPVVDSSTFVHHFASVIGQVKIGSNVFVGPFSSIRGDEGLRIYIGNNTNIQDGVVLHGLKNFNYKSVIVDNSVFKNNEPYSIYVDENVSLAHQSQVHGPARIDTNVFVGMQSLVFDSYIKENVIIEPGAKVIGVTIPENRYVRAGQVVTEQTDADQLPEITPDYRYYGFNKKVVDVNKELTQGYKGDTKNGRIT